MTSDILSSQKGDPPQVFIRHTELGLRPDDDVDAICFNEQANTVLFSLARNSPTLQRFPNGSAADLFLSQRTGALPTRFALATQLGLQQAISNTTPDDNVDALKCLRPLPCAPPVCSPKFKPGAVDVEIKDEGSGLLRIIIERLENGIVEQGGMQKEMTPVQNTEPFSFERGQTKPVTITARRKNPALSGRIVLQVINQTGWSTLCDPLTARIVIPPGGSATTVAHFTPRGTGQYPGVPGTEGTLLIQNGTPGIRALLISINGKNSVVTGLIDGQERSVNIAPFMKPGDNTVVLTGYGKAGDWAEIVIHDGK